jgi:hypothetical protein
MPSNAPYNLAILVYAAPGVKRDALTEEKYSSLAEAFAQAGFRVQSVSYNDNLADTLTTTLQQFNAILVWINPIEQGNDRKRLDRMLVELSKKNCFVSTHPEVILKMGTKDILFKTKEMPWGGDIRMYNSYEDFVSRFKDCVSSAGIRVLKQFRGNGGNGVFKIEWRNGDVVVLHAAQGNEPRLMKYDNFLTEFRSFFNDNGILIDQPWNEHMENGMVRCYVSGNRVAGFGYQEINAMYPSSSGFLPPSKRYYYTEECGLFSDLRDVMQSDWIPALQERLSIADNMMPVIWDADFFINGTDLPTAKKYTLCEINVSCVSPFPPSAVKHMVEETRRRLPI